MFAYILKNFFISHLHSILKHFWKAIDICLLNQKFSMNIFLFRFYFYLFFFHLFRLKMDAAVSEFSSTVLSFRFVHFSFSQDFFGGFFCAYFFYSPLGLLRFCFIETISGDLVWAYPFPWRSAQNEDNQQENVLKVFFFYTFLQKGRAIFLMWKIVSCEPLNIQLHDSKMKKKKNRKNSKSNPVKM